MCVLSLFFLSFMFFVRIILGLVLSLFVTLQDGEVLASLAELLSLIKSQQQDIQELRQQLNSFQVAQQQNTTAVAHEVQNVEERLSKRLENSLNDFSREECILPKWSYSILR